MKDLQHFPTPQKYFFSSLLDSPATNFMGQVITKSAAKKANANFWRDRSVLVTGGTGLIGSWLTEDLVSKGAPIVA
jgi:3-oxoacyl-ACP reductase-like protein